MSVASPDSVLYSSDGYELSVQNSVAIPAGTRAVIIAGSDGTNARFFKSDASGNTIIVGLGVAGTPSGGVVSIQGVSGGTVIPVSITGTNTISGTVTANQGTANTLANSWPVEISDGTNILGTSSHAIRIDPVGTTTQPVSGTVTANIGTTNGVALDTSVNGILVAQGSATSGEKGPLIQAAVTTASPAYTTAQTSPLSLTLAGALRTDSSATTQPVSGTITVQQSTAASLNATVVGTITSNQGTANTIANAWPIEITDGANILGTSSHPIRIDPTGATTQPISGTITANIGTTNGLALDTSINGILVSQGSTTTGEKGPLIQGAVTTASPTYTTAQTSPLSLTTAGALRIDGSATTQPISGTITANQGGAPWSANITQFGGTNISTGTGAGGVGIPRVTVSNDSNILATQSGSWAVVASQATASNFNATVIGTGTDNTVNSTSKLPVIAAVATTAAPTYSNNNMVPLSTDTSGNLRVSGTFTSSGASDTTASGTLSALNSTVQVAVTGLQNAGMQLSSGTLIGTIVPEVSFDGGTTWVSTFFDDPSADNKISSIVFASSNGAITQTIIGAGGASHVRVRVSAFTSGSATCNLRSSNMRDPSVLFSGQTGISTIPPSSALISAMSYGVTRNPRVDRFGHVRVATDNLLFFDPIEAGSSTAPNPIIWSNAASTMTIVQNGNINGGIVLNNGSSVTANASAILFSDKKFQIMNHGPIKASFRAKFVQGSTNSVLELGVGNATGNTAQITDGAIFRLNSSQVLSAVFTSNSVDQSVIISPTLSSSQFYNFIIYIDEVGAQFIIESSGGVPIFSTTINVPVGNGSQFLANHLPIYARVYNSGTAPASAPQLILHHATVLGMDLNTNKRWEHQMATVGRMSMMGPVTFTSTSNVAAGAGPTAGTPSNTTALYTTLGGEYNCNATATSENLLSVFAFTIPTNYNLYITDIFIPPPVVQGAAVATTATNIQFAVVANCGSTNISTGGGQLFTIPGTFVAPTATAIGGTFSGTSCIFTPTTPIPCISGTVLHIAYKVFLGTATASSRYRGSVTINGYFE